MKKNSIPPFPAEELFSQPEEQPAYEIASAALPSQPSRDDRRWSRGNVPAAGRGCQVKIGEEVFPARLLNKSADGFGVFVHCLDRPKVGQIVQLQTDVGWLPIRVVYAVQTAPPAKPDEHDHGPGFRLGCSRRLKQPLLAWLWGQ